jgi:hypothetical protein
MTDREFAILAKSINEVYPGAIKESGMELWYRLLTDVNYRQAAQSLAEYMRTEHFPPRPADLINRVEKKNRFCNFAGRDYDWGKLEKELLIANMVGTGIAERSKDATGDGGED